MLFFFTDSCFFSVIVENFAFVEEFFLGKEEDARRGAACTGRTAVRGVGIRCYKVQFGFYS